MDLVRILLPEIVLVIAACALFLFGFAKGKLTAQHAAGFAALAMLIALVIALGQYRGYTGQLLVDSYGSFRVGEAGLLMKGLCLCVGVLLLMLSWPTREDGNASLELGRDAGEYFGLLLLAFTGLLVCIGASDMITLFMGIELASIPTYILVAIGRPLPQAQEAALKYFFLGAMSAAVQLMGLGFLYGATGTTDLHDVGVALREAASHAATPGTLSSMALLGVVLATVGIAFKLAAFPMHAYVADVYEGAATPVTAALSFIPKATGLFVLVKLLYAVGGLGWTIDPRYARVLWAMAALTMTLGNVMALVQVASVKRVFAYSSVAHSGYILVGLATLAMSNAAVVDRDAVQSVLFYILAYGLTSVASFGVLTLIPSRAAMEIKDKKYLAPATTAETYNDLAGVGRTSPWLGVVMTIACLSLIGFPLTAGFLGKYFLLVPSLNTGNPWLGWLAAITLANAAISAAYYLRIVVTMFSSTAPADAPEAPQPIRSAPLLVSVGAAVALTLALGIILPSSQGLYDRLASAALPDEVPALSPSQAASPVVQPEVSSAR